MDLVAGVKRRIVVMEHCNKKGESKFIPRCTLPLTGKCCVDMLITDLAVFEKRGARFMLTEVAPGHTVEDVLSKTTAHVDVAPNVTTVDA